MSIVSHHNVANKKKIRYYSKPWHLRTILENSPNFIAFHITLNTLWNTFIVKLVISCGF